MVVVRGGVQLYAAGAAVMRAKVGSTGQRAAKRAGGNSINVRVRPALRVLLRDVIAMMSGAVVRR